MSPTQVGDHLPAVLRQARQRQAQRHVRLTEPRKAGRPTRLHDGLIDRVCDLIRRGATQRHACLALGIPERTFLSWKARGTKADAEMEANGTVPDQERVYLRFLHAIEGARAEAAVEVVDALKRLALGETVSEIEVVYDEETDEEVARIVRFEKPSERAMEFYLERSHPADYAKRIEVSGPDQSAIPVEVEVSARESIRKRLGQVGKRLLPDESGAS